VLVDQVLERYLLHLFLGAVTTARELSTARRDVVLVLPTKAKHGWIVQRLDCAFAGSSRALVEPGSLRFWLSVWICLARS